MFASPDAVTTNSVGQGTGPGIVHAVIAGVVCAVVAFTGTFAVVISGLRGVGATPEQAASGLLIISLTMGLGCVLFSWRLKMPVTFAWSTPGAALLASAAVPAGGFSTAVGAFIVTGVLLLLTGLVRPLGRAVAAIPRSLASAMLAGVLLTLCVAPARALVDQPAAIAPVVLAWLVFLVIARRWAVVAALVAAVVVMGVTGALGAVNPATARPVLLFIAPHFHPAAILAIGVPLYIVTMTSQNIPGVAVLDSFGYRLHLRNPLLYSGAATSVGALAGGQAINLAAISAALAAGPEAHPDPRRRWVAGVACGLTYLAFGPISGVVAAAANAAPHGLLQAVAGLALIGTFAGSAATALGDADHRESAAITLLVAASGIAVFGIGAAFWGLLAGLVHYALIGRRALRARG